jgi:ABC-type multidrug transport system, ATPase component
MNTTKHQDDCSVEVLAVSKRYSKKPGFFEMFKKKSNRSGKGHVDALVDVSFMLKPGFYALLGPNGSGKSTLINIMTGSMKPNKGVVYYNGTSISKLSKEYRRILGYTPQQQTLYPSFSGRQFLGYMCALKGFDKEQNREIERVAAIVGLSDELEKTLGAYSGGMKQRILAASALIGAPRVIIMDEPTAGLDPKERVILRERIALLAKENIVLMATHVVSDVESVADCVIFLKKGHVVAMGSVDELIEKYCPQQGLEDVYLSIFGREEER